MTDDYRGAAFFVREHGRRIATPLLAVLVVIETTRHPVRARLDPGRVRRHDGPVHRRSASNMFAILGLRSLYFLLAGLLDRFVYLKTGLAALLVFAGAKILGGLVNVDIPIALSLGVIVGILAVAIGASIISTSPNRDQHARGDRPDRHGGRAGHRRARVRRPRGRRCGMERLGPDRP